MHGRSRHSPGCIMINKLFVFIYSYSYMKTYSLCVMINPGESLELPYVGGIYWDRLGDSLHIYVFIYASSYMISKHGEAAYVYQYEIFNFFISRPCLSFTFSHECASVNMIYGHNLLLSSFWGFLAQKKVTRSQLKYLCKLFRDLEIITNKLKVLKTTKKAHKKHIKIEKFIAC